MGWRAPKWHALGGKKLGTQAPGWTHCRLIASGTVATQGRAGGNLCGCRRGGGRHFHGCLRDVEGLSRSYRGKGGSGFSGSCSARCCRLLRRVSRRGNRGCHQRAPVKLQIKCAVTLTVLPLYRRTGIRRSNAYRIADLRVRHRLRWCRRAFSRNPEQ